MRKIDFSPPDISEGEIEEVISVLRSGWITTGCRAALLERRLHSYIETGDVNALPAQNIKNAQNAWNTQNVSDQRCCRVVCFNSATAAEEMCLRLLGIEPEDEVIVPAYTYTATASAVLHTGAKLVFVDILKDGDNLTHAPALDYEALADRITEKTKAIVAVDYGGILCDYEKIYSVIEGKRDIYIYHRSQAIHFREQP